MKKCKFCAEEIQDEAIVCKYCKNSLIKGKNKGDNKMGVGCCVFLVIIFLFIIISVFTDSNSNNSTNSTNNVSTTSNPDKTEALVIARNFVKAHLNYPDASEFPGMFDQDYSVVISGNEYTVRHWVLASNAFGVKKKTFYFINLKYKSGDWADANNWEELNFKFSE